MECAKAVNWSVSGRQNNDSVMCGEYRATERTSANCKHMRGTMRRSDRPIPGFICAVGAKLLMHALMQDNTGASGAIGS